MSKYLGWIAFVLLVLVCVWHIRDMKRALARHEKNVDALIESKPSHVTTAEELPFFMRPDGPQGLEFPSVRIWTSVDSETRIVIPEDHESFTVTEKEIVRLTVKAIPGDKIKIDATGPIKTMEHIISHRKNGRAVIGSSDRSIDVTSIRTGKASVAITITPRSGEPRTLKWEFEITQ